MTDRRLLRGAALIMLLAVTGFAAWIVFAPRLNPTALLPWLRSVSGLWWVVPAYVVAYALLTVLFIPTQALSIAAVLLWGWWRGGIVELLAATVASVLPFLITRTTLRELIAARLQKHRRVTEVLEREGFTLLLVLRIVPILPYTILNYVAGLSSLRLWQYVVSTFAGMIPSVFIFAYCVQAIADGILQPRQVVMRGLIAALMLAALVVATRFAAPRVRRRIES